MLLALSGDGMIWRPRTRKRKKLRVQLTIRVGLMKNRPRSDSISHLESGFGIPLQISLKALKPLNVAVTHKFFCLLGDPADLNPDPLILDQWSFYVIRTCSFNGLLELQKTIGLEPLRRLISKETGRCEVKYPDLAGVISDQLAII